MASQAQLKKQQGEWSRDQKYLSYTKCLPELQTTYQNYKNTLQTIAQKIGDIEQETEEHKYVPSTVISDLQPDFGIYTAPFPCQPCVHASFLTSCLHLFTPLRHAQRAEGSTLNDIGSY